MFSPDRLIEHVLEMCISLQSFNQGRQLCLRELSDSEVAAAACYQAVNESSDKLSFIQIMFLLMWESLSMSGSGCTLPRDNAGRE